MMPANERPEYGDSPRRFAVAMLMVGAITVQRFVEHVLAELNAELAEGQVPT